jgi:hypothetical protein
VAIAKAAGFVISAEELEAAASAQVGNLSDEDLESVTGGAALGYTNYCTVYTCKPKCK